MTAPNFPNRERSPASSPLNPNAATVVILACPIKPNTKAIAIPLAAPMLAPFFQPRIIIVSILTILPKVIPKNSKLPKELNITEIKIPVAKSSSVDATLSSPRSAIAGSPAANIK